MLPASLRECYKAGRAAARKPSTENCSVRFFVSVKYKNEWERGYEEEKAHPTPEDGDG